MANRGKTEVQNNQQENLQQCASAAGFADDSVRRRRDFRLVRLRRTRPTRRALVLISTALMLKCVSNLALQVLQGFIDFFSAHGVPLCYPDYPSVSRRAKSINVNIKTQTRGEIAHMFIDSSRLKVFAEGEWKVKSTARKTAAKG